MNCKQGDLALVQHPTTAGLIVMCIELITEQIAGIDPAEGVLWHIDQELTYSYKGIEVFLPLIPDKYLKPIPPLEEIEKEKFLNDMDVLTKMSDSFVADKIHKERMRKLGNEMRKLSERLNKKNFRGDDENSKI